MRCTIGIHRKWEAKTKNRTFLLLHILAMTLTLSVSTPANGKLLVGPGQQYSTIQAAVDAANEGSEILVFPDTYNESVAIAKSNLRIIAQGEGVVVEPPETAGFLVHADHVFIQGFEIAYGAECARAIEFLGSHNTSTDNHIFLNSSCIGVNALICRDPDGGSDNNIIKNNIIEAADLGIVITAETDDAINTGDIIKNNTLLGVAQSHIVVENAKGFQILDNLVEGAPFGHCLAVGSFGDNKIEQGFHEIVGNAMFNCAGNGISLYASPGTTLTRNFIFDNTIQGCGKDCLALEAGEGAFLTHNVVSANETSFSQLCSVKLGAYDLENTGGVTVSYNWVRDNTVYRNLSGICLLGGGDINLVVNNLVEDQNADGILVASDKNLLMSNNSHNNEGDGILVQGNINKMLLNIALNNGVYDLADEGKANRWQANVYNTSNW